MPLQHLMIDQRIWSRPLLESVACTVVRVDIQFLFFWGHALGYFLVGLCSPACILLTAIRHVPSLETVTGYLAHVMPGEFSSLPQTLWRL